MYAGAPTVGLADGTDEVHKARVARRVLEGYRPHDGHFPREFIPYKRDAAWKQMRPLFDADPELAAAAEDYRARRGSQARLTSSSQSSLK